MISFSDFLDQNPSYIVPTNSDISRAIHRYNKADIELSDYMLAHCCYSETVIHNGAVLTRRPVVIINNQGEYNAAKKLTEDWIKAQENLCKTDPWRFPMGSELFVSKPKILTHVQAVNIYKNNATNSRIIPKNAIVKKLKRAASKHELRQSTRSLDYTNILNSIDYFTSCEEEKFRLRTGGYSEIVLILSVLNADDIKFKVSERGVFLLPCNNVDLYAPLKSHTRKKRASIFDNITVVPHHTGYHGELYRQSDIDAALMRK